MTTIVDNISERTNNHSEKYTMKKYVKKIMWIRRNYKKMREHKIQNINNLSTKYKRGQLNYVMEYMVKFPTEWIKQGDLLGLCGNSGNSTEPHLHFHIQNVEDMNKATGAKSYFENILVSGELKKDYSPVKTEKVKNK